MTSLSLKQVVEQALADIGVSPKLAQKPKGKARTTTWIAVENGFGIRHYATGRHVACEHGAKAQLQAAQACFGDPSQEHDPERAWALKVLSKTFSITPFTRVVDH